MNRTIKTKTVEIDGQTVKVKVYAPAETNAKPKMKLRGKQTHNMNLDTIRWSRGV